MNVTGTGIAIALALATALGFMFYGPAVFTSSSPVVNPISMTNDQSASAGAAELPTELTIEDKVVGTGQEAATGDTVTVNYVGAFPDGTVFDASANHAPGTFTFRLGVDSVIEGWQQGLIGMKEGGTRILVIPPDLAYGPGGSGPIPPNATLLFKVDLVSVTKAR